MKDEGPASGEGSCQAIPDGRRSIPGCLQPIIDWRQSMIGWDQAAIG